MGAVFAYSLCVTVVTLLIYPMLHLSVFNWGKFHVNRFLLLGSIIISLALPMLFIPVREPNVSSHTSIDDILLFVQNTDTLPEITISSIVSIALFVYTLGCCFMLVCELVSFVYLFKIIRNGKKIVMNDHVICSTSDKNQSPFSWGKYIVIPETKCHEAIMQHELAHRRKHHWIDILLIDCFCIFLWYNPFAWIIKRLIRHNHEFEADRAVIDGGINAYDYQMLLLENAGFKKHSKMGHNFSSKLQCIRQRIKFLNGKRTASGHKWSLLTAIPTLTACIVALSLPLSAKIIENMSGFKLSWPKFQHSGKLYISDVKQNGKIISSENIIITLPDNIPETQTYKLNLLSGKDHLLDDIYISLKFDQFGNITEANPIGKTCGNTKAKLNKDDNSVQIETETSQGKTLLTKFIPAPDTK